jgi:N-methylhydantoinase A
MPHADIAAPSLTLAVDVGGTFTDITLRDDNDGAAWRAKVPSTPDDPSRGFLAGIEAVLAVAGQEAERIGRVLHGTTVATNLILEGKGARTALVTTRGFRHVLEIGRQDIPRAANLYAWVKPSRPVPPSRIVEVDERIGAGGRILAPLDEASVAAAAEALRAMDVQAVGICLLHAYAEPAHERRVAELLRAALPGVAITASTDVLPVVREYERGMATALNAAVMPAVTSYVARLAGRLVERGVPGPLLLMQSNGGVAGAATIGRAPAVTALSGPAAGVIGAREVGRACGLANLITIDIGGTSADISLIAGGRIERTDRGHVGEWPLPLPMLDMVTIGAGGGSLARVRDGALLVGPESAGAVPGPACYGRGGSQATLTDAHVVLGHLPGDLLDGRMALDATAAETAVHNSVAAPLGLDLHTAARGILAIADNAMVGAIRVISVERGHDPRDFALVAFGGAGPLHGCALAELLGIRTVVVPPSPGVLCAEGLLAADLRTDFSRTLVDTGAIEPVFRALEGEAAAWFAEEQVAPHARQIARVALMRYAGQGNELSVPWPGGVEAAEASFRSAHESLYGFNLPAPIEIVTLRVEAVGRADAPDAAQLAPGNAPAPTGRATIWTGTGAVEAGIHRRGDLAAGARLSGPAIVTQLDSTTLIPPGWHAVVHASGSLILKRAG